MTSRQHRVAIGATTFGLAATLALTGCAPGGGPSGTDDKGTDAASDTAQPHGYVEGAEESAEPQNGLIFADAATGEVHLLDLLSGDTSTLSDGDKKAPTIDALRTDGRYAYASTASTGALSVFDGGTWTVDHGDHKHYYRTAPDTVGVIDGAAGASVASSRTFVAISGAGEGSPRASEPGAADDSVGGPTGRSTASAAPANSILDRAKLDDGSLAASADLTEATAGAALAVPFGENLITVAGAATDSPAGTVQVHGPDAADLGTLTDTCSAPSGTATARTGIVIGCADGALLVTDTSGSFASEKIAYPGTLPAGSRATSFDYRPGANYLAARAADNTVLSLDVSDRAWSVATTAAPVSAVTSPGDGSTVLALLADGTLNSYSTDDGSLLTSVPLLGGGTSAGADAASGTPSIQIDTARAYVNDAGTRQIHEIDYADGLRLTRSFDTTITPSHLVEVGR
jgi:hypothetical protein